MGNPMYQQQNQKRKFPTHINDGVLESLRGVGGSVGKTITKDVVSGVGADIVQSFFGTPRSGDLYPNQPIEFIPQKIEMEKKVPPAIRTETPRIDTSQDDRETKQKVEGIRKELKALSQSITQLNQEVKKTITEAPVSPGVYHLNFYEHLRTFIQVMREQIDDSRTWLATSSKRKQKKGYWGMYKKHGTTFGLSGERNIATSAG